MWFKKLHNASLNLAKFLGIALGAKNMMTDVGEACRGREPYIASAND